MNESELYVFAVEKNNTVIGTFYTTLYQIVRHWRATAHNIINAIRSERVATMAYISVSSYC